MKSEKVFTKVGNNKISIEYIYSKGQKLKDLVNTYEEYVYLLKGRADIIINNKVIKLKQGDFIRIDKNIKHDVINYRKKNIWFCIYFK